MIMAIKKKISASAIKQFTIEDKRLNDTEIPRLPCSDFQHGSHRLLPLLSIRWQTGKLQDWLSQ